jgi:hypothetical protein
MGNGSCLTGAYPISLWRPSSVPVKSGLWRMEESLATLPTSRQAQAGIKGLSGNSLLKNSYHCHCERSEAIPDLLRGGEERLCALRYLKNRLTSVYGFNRILVVFRTL